MSDPMRPTMSETATEVRVSESPEGGSSKLGEFTFYPAKQFVTLRADLTRYDSPESETLRKKYGITGVPTVLFIAPDGREVRPARVEGFLPPEKFLERMERATHALAGS